MFYQLCVALSVLVVGLVGHAESRFTAEQGKVLYDNYCQTCHGEDMVNPGTVSYDLRKFPEGSKARFLASVSNGKNGMPSWKSVVTPEDMERLWLYVLTRGQ
jgi:mono/diheme cytochrome c family protein